MGYRFLGNKVEYEQAAKRLEEIAFAEPGTPEATKYKELLNYFIRFERETKSLDSQALKRKIFKK